MNGNLVTICITTFNRDFLIETAIENVLKQTYRNIEVLIVDDCSTDNTKAICENLENKYGQVKYIRHDRNLGLSTARNTAIENSSGLFFTFIDDDDLWEESFVEEFVKLAIDYDDNWCFCCGVKNITDYSTSIIVPFFNGELKKYFELGYTPPVAAQFYFTSTLKKIRGYNENILSGVDHDLWLKLSAFGIKIKSLEKALAIPNQDNTLNRMTTNVDQRLSRIKKSLLLWQPMLNDLFGEEFYAKFYNAYIKREIQSFLWKKLDTKGLIHGTKYYLKNSDHIEIRQYFKGIIKLFLRRVRINKGASCKIINYPPALVIK